MEAVCPAAHGQECRSSEELTFYQGAQFPLEMTLRHRLAVGEICLNAHSREAEQSSEWPSRAGLAVKPVRRTLSCEGFANTSWGCCTCALVPARARAGPAASRHSSALAAVPGRRPARIPSKKVFGPCVFWIGLILGPRVFWITWDDKRP